MEARFDGWKLQDGHVKILFTNGEFYEGNIKDNNRELTGKMFYKNGDVFEGEWFKDKRGGNRGKITTLDGNKLTGQFIKDLADGSVEYEDKEGNIFVAVTDLKSAENMAVMQKGLGKNANKAGETNKESQPGTFSNGRLYK